MAVEHNALPKEAQHIIHRWKVADETEFNAIVPTIDDLDKIALRVDNDTFYRLKSHDPIAWVEVGSSETVDLSNYYTKSETYNKTEIDTAIASVTPAELTNNLSHITQIKMTHQEGSIYKYTPPLTTWFTLPFNYASIDDLLQFDDITHTITAKKTGYYIINMSVVHLQTTTDGSSAWTRYALVDGSFDTILTTPTYGNSHYYSQTFSSEPVGLQETISLYLTIGQSIKILMYTGHSTAYIGTNNETDTFCSAYINMYMLSGVGVVNEGLNAYELAVQEGFVGAEIDWLASLKGDKGDKGDAGADGADGIDGVGVPTGGTAGQILAKVDNTDYNTEWIDAPTGGGSAEYPDMTGNAGKVLGTDGTSVSWVDNGDAVALNMRYAGVSLYISASPGGAGANTNWLTNWYGNNTMDISQKVSDSRLLLKAGRTYRIIGGIESSNGTTTSGITTKLYSAKVSDGVFTEVEGGYSYNVPVSNTSHIIRNHKADCYIKTDEDMWVECRVDANSAGTVTNFASDYMLTEYLNVTGEGAITLPPVTNQSGKFLSNNGTDIEWVKPEFNGLSELPNYELGVEKLLSERWINGKPIYRMTIDCGVVPTNTAKTIAIPNYNSNNEYWVDLSSSYIKTGGGSIFSLTYFSSTSTQIMFQLTGGNIWIDADNTAFAGGQVYITIRYTKSTDTANSPVKLIGSAYNISNNEYILPYTRNGKTVYGIEIDCGNMPNSTTKNVAIPNYNNAYDYDIVKLKASDSAYHINVPIQWSGSTYIERWITRASGSLTIVSNFNASSLTGKAVLEYTKN